MVDKTTTYRQRRAADTARWRKRRQSGRAVYPVEVDGQTFDLMEKFGVLTPENAADRRAVSIAVGKLLGRGLEALMREAARRR